MYYLCYFCSEGNRNSLHNYAVNKSRVLACFSDYLSAGCFGFIDSVFSTCKSLGASVDVCVYIFFFYKEISLFNVNATILMCILMFQKLNWSSFWRQLI